MNIILYNYFQAFLHPFKFNGSLRNQREKEQNKWDAENTLRLAKEGESRPETLMGLSFVESVGVSWVFAILRALYAFFGLWLGKYAVESMGFGGQNFDSKKMILIFQIGQVVFFPLMAWIYVKFWTLLIIFFGILYDKEEQSSEIADEILVSSLSTNIFLAIPVLGGFLQKASSLLFIFIGLRENMKLGTLQSLFVVISPVILFFLILLFGASAMMAIFQSF